MVMLKYRFGLCSQYRDQKVSEYDEYIPKSHPADQYYCTNSTKYAPTVVKNMAFCFVTINIWLDVFINISL